MSISIMVPREKLVYKTPPTDNAEEDNESPTISVVLHFNSGDETATMIEILRAFDYIISTLNKLQISNTVIGK